MIETYSCIQKGKEEMDLLLSVVDTLTQTNFYFSTYILLFE